MSVIAITVLNILLTPILIIGVLLIIYHMYGDMYHKYFKCLDWVVKPVHEMIFPQQNQLAAPIINTDNPELQELVQLVHEEINSVDSDLVALELQKEYQLIASGQDTTDMFRARRSRLVSTKNSFESKVESATDVAINDSERAEIGMDEVNVKPGDAEHDRGLLGKKEIQVGDDIVVQEDHPFYTLNYEELDVQKRQLSKQIDEIEAVITDDMVEEDKMSYEEELKPLVDDKKIILSLMKQKRKPYLDNRKLLKKQLKNEKKDLRKSKRKDAVNKYKNRSKSENKKIADEMKVKANNLKSKIEQQPKPTNMEQSKQHVKNIQEYNRVKKGEVLARLAARNSEVIETIPVDVANENIANFDYAITKLEDQAANDEAKLFDIAGDITILPIEKSAMLEDMLGNITMVPDIQI